jgi:hypothetical protein
MYALAANSALDASTESIGIQMGQKTLAERLLNILLNLIKIYFAGVNKLDSLDFLDYYFGRK